MTDGTGSIDGNGSFDENRSIDDVLANLRRGLTDLRPGQGHTAELWELLGALAVGDLGVARAVEPHLDALAILDQAGPETRFEGFDGPDGLAWGVFAAEGPAATLTAKPDGAGWRLD